MKFVPGTDPKIIEEANEYMNKKVQNLKDFFTIAITSKQKGNENAFEDAKKLVYGEDDE